MLLWKVVKVLKCPQCKVEMSISGVKTEVNGDTSPDIPTVVYTVQELACRNPKCGNYQRVMHEVRTQIFPPVEA